MKRWCSTVEFELFVEGLREKYNRYGERLDSGYYDYGSREDYISAEIKCDLLGDILNIAVEALNSCKQVKEDVQNGGE